MARRLAHLCGRAAARLCSSPAGSILGVAERCFAVNGLNAANAFSATQLWQPTSVRGFASENESATGYADEFDFVSYPPPRAFVGQVAPDFEAPGNTPRSVSLASTLSRVLHAISRDVQFAYVCIYYLGAATDLLRMFNCSVVTASGHTCRSTSAFTCYSKHTESSM